MTVMEQARTIRAAMDNAAIVLTDEQAVFSKELYPKWEELMGQTVELGFRVRYDDALYRTLQKSYSFVEHYVPGAGTESLFAKIDEAHAGTAEDPIPYEVNMALEEGKHYSQNGVVYRCIWSTGIPVYHPLSELVGLYVEVVS